MTKIACIIVGWYNILSSSQVIHFILIYERFPLDEYIFIYRDIYLYISSASLYDKLHMKCTLHHSVSGMSLMTKNRLILSITDLVLMLNDNDIKVV